MRTTRHRLLPVITVLLAMWVMVLTAAPASAHGGGDSEEAHVLVVDALAYLVNQPDGYLDNVTDKVGDALEAPDTDGVDLSKVELAQQALDAGDLKAVRTYLTESLLPITEPVTGLETGTTAMPDPMSGHTEWSGTGWTYAVLSGLGLLVGLALAFRWRPDDTMAELRSHLSEGQS